MGLLLRPMDTFVPTVCGLFFFFFFFLPPTPQSCYIYSPCGFLTTFILFMPSSVRLQMFSLSPAWRAVGAI
ncbi:hypothetical protein POVWA2_024090 [Plasmodium ovale wallikeri]|uniref:Uncharacterized protein n=1 Tax=Plasmodium ovale wallikeri TaxID=864142 RepID=A0A1A8YUP2_PLAOA|nr:hypothetical protein POVWA1_024210 [Plasmodium ovale wallikeri]SBT35244.1 hypothetical protein POVWA2_024090 [Plasmodium ovale wallikeri]